jgi:hypothetical protein
LREIVHHWQKRKGSLTELQKKFIGIHGPGKFFTHIAKTLANLSTKRRRPGIDLAPLFL